MQATFCYIPFSTTPHDNKMGNRTWPPTALIAIVVAIRQCGSAAKYMGGRYVGLSSVVSRMGELWTCTTVVGEELQEGVRVLQPEVGANFSLIEFC